MRALIIDAYEQACWDGRLQNCADMLTTGLDDQLLTDLLDQLDAGELEQMQRELGEHYAAVILKACERAVYRPPRLRALMDQVREHIRHIDRFLADGVLRPYPSRVVPLRVVQDDDGREGAP